MKRLFFFLLTIFFSPSIWSQIPTVSIVLNGGWSTIHAIHLPFSDPGFTATDSVLNDYSMYVSVSGMINTDVLGMYQLIYSIHDSIAKAPTVIRTVIVEDTVPPVIQLLGPVYRYVYPNDPLNDPGVKLSDNYYSDQTLKQFLTVTYSENFLLNNEPGFISYHLTDPSGNRADSVSRIYIPLFGGVAEIEEAPFIVYPNPAYDMVTIKSNYPVDHCFLLDALGNIAPIRTNESASGLQVDLSVFDDGIYTLIIESDQQRHFSTLVLTQTR